MDLFIIITLIAIFVETTFIAIKNIKKPFANSTKQRRKVYIDTSVLMDGRILELSKTGFIGDYLYIPRSVIRELQLLADGKDSEKRNRARFGLDVANNLERSPDCHVEIVQDDLDRTLVDERLISLAKENHGLILTNDYNLNKVANTEKIKVLNINDLALSLRMDYLPGDTFKLAITSAGSNPRQGVGHLPDGTMVVVDNALSKIGKDVEVEFVRFFQTSAGRMMFAKIKGAPAPKPLKKPKSKPKS